MLNFTAMKNLLATIILFLLFFISGNAQPLSAYVNQDGRFFVFNNFQIQQADYLQPKYFLVGRTCVPLI